MGRGLIRQHVDYDAAGQEFGEHVRRIAEQRNRAGFLEFFRRLNIRSASSRVSVIVSTYPVFSRRSIRDRSTSIARHAAPFMVAASGCAPPMPPRPAVTSNLPAREPPN